MKTRSPLLVGSTSILPLRCCLIALFVVVLLVIAPSVLGMETAVRTKFKTDSEIKNWSKTNFLDHVTFTVKKEAVELLAVVATHTSGLATSQVFLYRKVGDGYDLILYRSEMLGVVKVAGDESGVHFNRKHDGKRVLFVSWDSIY